MKAARPAHSYRAARRNAAHGLVWARDGIRLAGTAYKPRRGKNKRGGALGRAKKRMAGGTK